MPVFSGYAFTDKRTGGTVTDVIGFNLVDLSSTTSTTNSYNGLVVNNRRTSGNITTFQAIVVGDGHTGGTITNGYGIVLGDINATNGYGIYQVGSNDINYLNGKVGIGKNNPTTNLDVNGGVSAKVTVASTNYVMTSSDFTIFADAGAGNINITLPTAGNRGQIVVIKKTDATANIVTINPAGGDLIESTGSKTLNTIWKSYTLQAGGGVDWIIISST